MPERRIENEHRTGRTLHWQSVSLSGTPGLGGIPLMVPGTTGCHRSRLNSQIVNINVDRIEITVKERWKSDESVLKTAGISSREDDVK